MSEANKSGRIAAARRALAKANAERPVDRYAARVARLRAASKRVRDEQGARWCILRTSSPRTLPLAMSLSEAGFDVWTPIATEIRSRPRCSAKVEREVAMMPGFVFARAEHQEQVNDLFRAHALVPSPHPPFSIFHQAGRVPTLPGDDIASLRKAEDAAEHRRLKKERRTFTPGTSVRINEPAFVGLAGVVQSCDGKRAQVEIGGFFSIEVAAWLLLPDAVTGSSSPEDTAALAA